MKYEICEKTLSKARLDKYSRACGQDKNKAIWLYQCNMKLSQRFYGVIGLFEVMLRNAINEHYKRQFDDEDWIINQCAPGCLLADDKESIEKAHKEFMGKGVYTNDKMVASFTLGFWTYLFTRRNYRVGKKTLLRIFPDKSHGVMQRDVYRELTEIREFRNRIAHYEPICFDASGRVGTAFARHHYELIRKYIAFMGIPADSALGFIEKPDAIIRRLEEFR